MKPVLQALLLADHVYQDKATGKMIIAGTFNRIRFRTIEAKASDDPAIGKGVQVKGSVEAMGTPYAYLNLTEIYGELPLTLRYVDLTNNSMVFHTKFGIKCDDPLAAVELIVPVPRLPADHAGVYALELLTGDEPIGSLRVVTEEMKDERSQD